MKYTIQQFRNEFPNDEACLAHLYNVRYGDMTQCPDCLEETKFQPVKGRRSFQCSLCSYQLFPTANTVFHKTTTPLTYWFYAIYLFTTTRNGVAAKELERQLCIYYKTALRMAHQIKNLMADKKSIKLFGEVLVDETYLGVLSKNMHSDITTNQHVNKTDVMGFMDKEGKIVTKVLGVETGNNSFASIVLDNVDTYSILVTDSFPAYKSLGKVFKKQIRINHDNNEYVKEGFATNIVENYWSTRKRMIKRTHIHVSSGHLSKYVAENTFRYVNRAEPHMMFHKILSNVD